MLNMEWNGNKKMCVLWIKLHSISMVTTLHPSLYLIHPLTVSILFMFKPCHSLHSVHSHRIYILTINWNPEMNVLIILVFNLETRFNELLFPFMAMKQEQEPEMRIKDES